MALVGSSNEEKIWNYLRGKGINAFGVAGLMGNLYAESGLRPNNLQNSFEKKLGMSDEKYTEVVDKGTYDNFIKDSAGYGLAQWTYWSRKKNLLLFVQSKKKSIGDLETQLDFLYNELSTSYKGVLNAVKSATSVRKASDVILTQFERPADQSEAVQKRRAEFGQTFYEKYAGAQPQNGGNTMANSSLVTYTRLASHHYGARNHAVDRISPHCFVGQVTGKRGADYFATTTRSASSNYIVGTDGSVGLSVEEKNAAMTTSSKSNDERAITIEIASDTTHPYAMTEKAYQKTIELMADICRRYGKKKLIWFGDKNKSLNYTPKADEMVITVHRWFAAKACPGDWLYKRLGEVAEKVTAMLGGNAGGSSGGETGKTYPATPFTVKVLVSDLNYRSEPSMSGAVKGQTGKGSFTITEVKNGWGKLKSGVGWIYLENATYVSIGGSTASAPAKKSVNEVAKEVLLGRWGNGAERKRRLEAAGYNYAEVQAAVNKLK